MIYDYDLKALIEDLLHYINIGGKTVSVVIADNALFKKKTTSASFYLENKTDHVTIYLNGEAEEFYFPCTESYTGWFYTLIKCLYIIMFQSSGKDYFYFDRLTKGMLKLLSPNYLDQFKIGDTDER